MFGTYILYIIVGPEAVFTMLWRFSHYCIRFTTVIAFNRWYRFAFAIAVFGLVSVFLIILPCIQTSAQDRLSCIEETLTLLLHKMSAIEDSQRMLEENQREALQLLRDLHDQDGQ